MLEPRARQQPALPARELPRLPAVSDNALVMALVESSEQLPFGARLPSPAVLIAEALASPPPTRLHEQFQRHIGQALSALAVAAGSAAAAATALSPLNAFNAFQQTAVSSSDPAAISGFALSGARIASYRISVERLATAQENAGMLLPRELPAALAPGLHRIELRDRAGAHAIAFDLSPGDNNDTLLAKLAAAVNQTAPEVLATLVRPTAGLVGLVLSASCPGAAGAFELTEPETGRPSSAATEQVSGIAGSSLGLGGGFGMEMAAPEQGSRVVGGSEDLTSGATLMAAAPFGRGSRAAIDSGHSAHGLLDTIGVGRVARPAQDAVFVLNGIRTLSPDNTVALDRGQVQLMLGAAAPGVERTIGVGADARRVLDAVAELARAVSQMAGTINDNIRYFSRNFANEFSATIQPLRPRLERVGIQLSRDNRMALDAAAFEAAFARDQTAVETVISSADGVAQTIGQFAAGMMSAPISRFAAPEFIPPMLPPTSHPTPPMLLASNTLSALLYAQLLAQGLFINTLF